MNFFGMGPLELLVVLVLALVFLGPEKLPEMAAQVGKVVRDLRRISNELSTEFNQSMAEIQSIQNVDLNAELGLAERPTAGTTLVEEPAPTEPPDYGRGAAAALAERYGTDQGGALAAQDAAEDAAAFETLNQSVSEPLAPAASVDGELLEPSASAVATLPEPMAAVATPPEVAPAAVTHVPAEPSPAIERGDEAAVPAAGNGHVAGASHDDLLPPY